jgi:hypothetical protein
MNEGSWEKAISAQILDASTSTSLMFGFAFKNKHALEFRHLGTTTIPKTIDTVLTYVRERREGRDSVTIANMNENNG